MIRKAIKPPTETLTMILGTSSLEILKPLDNSTIKNVTRILTDNKIKFEVREDYFVVFTKYYMIETMRTLSCCYDLLVK